MGLSCFSVALTEEQVYARHQQPATCTQVVRDYYRNHMVYPGVFLLLSLICESRSLALLAHYSCACKEDQLDGTAAVANCRWTLSLSNKIRMQWFLGFDISISLECLQVSL